MRFGAASVILTNRGHVMSDDWLGMTAADLGRAIGARVIDPLELTKHQLAAIKADPLQERIYARLSEERALAEAAAASARAQSGHRLSVLDGVPISWKDLFDTAGLETEAGSAFLAGRVPTRDALVLQNATAAGLVCLGKTHMSELAFSGLGYNPITQSPPSVNDPDSVAGGSSSGAATSVAFGLATAGIGSDTGGSVRIPAAWNDLIGLKTTSGRLSLQGVVPLCAKFDTVGPLCRSVEDAALLMGALEGTPAPDLRGADLRGVRLLVLQTIALDDVREQPMGGFQNAILRLAGAGAIIEYGNVDCVTDALALTGTLYTTEAYATWKDEIEAAPEKMFAEILQRFRIGATVSGADYVRAWQQLDLIRTEWAQKTAQYDAVIMPTSPILPPNMNRLATDHDYYVAENLLSLRNTRIGNLMGSCALTLPTGIASSGISFVCGPHDEHRLLRIGAAAEAAMS